MKHTKHGLIGELKSDTLKNEIIYKNTEDLSTYKDVKKSIN